MHRREKDNVKAEARRRTDSAATAGSVPAPTVSSSNGLPLRRFAGQILLSAPGSPSIHSSVSLGEASLNFPSNPVPSKRKTDRTIISNRPLPSAGKKTPGRRIPALGGRAGLPSTSALWQALAAAGPTRPAAARATGAKIGGVSWKSVSLWIFHPPADHAVGAALRRDETGNRGINPLLQPEMSRHIFG